MDSDTAEALVRSSGLWEQLASVAPQVQAGLKAAMARDGASGSSPEAQRLLAAVDGAYAADRLRQSALAVVRKDIRAEHVPVLRNWFGTPLGLTVTRMEKTASSELKDPQAFAQQGRAVFDSSPANRRALLEEIVAVTRSAENAAQFNMETALAVRSGLAAAMPGGAGPSSQELRGALEAQQPLVLGSLRAFMLASYAKVYSALPTPELARYVEFLRSEPARHFTEVGMRASKAALLEAAAELGTRLPKPGYKPAR